MSFDPERFIGTEVTGKNSTTMIVPPEGVFLAVCSKLDGREFTSDKGDLYRVFELTWDLDDSDGQIQAVTHRETNRVRQTIFLDCITDEQGDFLGLSMDEGDNVGLGRTREALGQNDPTVPWSPSMFMGAAAQVQIKHGTDKNDNLRADVNAVLPIGG